MYGLRCSCMIIWIIDSLIWVLVQLIHLNAVICFTRVSSVFLPQELVCEREREKQENKLYCYLHPAVSVNRGAAPWKWHTCTLIPANRVSCYGRFPLWKCAASFVCIIKTEVDGRGWSENDEKERSDKERGRALMAISLCSQGLL